jgi:hypothetical protein
VNSVVTYVYKADPLGGLEVVPQEIHIVKNLPTYLTDPAKYLAQDWENTVSEFYRKQAEAVHDALVILPSGTLHALLIRMLERKRDLYRGVQSCR